MTDIEANVATFLGAREPTLRYSSFDYCFNYFQSHRQNPAELVGGGGLEASCLQLGYYLASWGMLRGSSAMLWRSSRHLAPLIHVIADQLGNLWGVDVDAYDDDTIPMLLAAEEAVRLALGDAPEVQESLAFSRLKGMHASQTLTTKILMGVFGCMPAFDSYFRRGFRVSRFGPKALWAVREFYDEHAATLDALRHPTIDFATGEATELMYPKAKLIDMVFFVEGDVRRERANSSSEAVSSVSALDGR